MDKKVQWALVVLLTAALAYAAHATRYVYPLGQQKPEWRIDRWTGTTQQLVCEKERPAQPGDSVYDVLIPPIVPGRRPNILDQSLDDLLGVRERERRRNLTVLPREVGGRIHSDVPAQGPLPRRGG